MKNQPFVSHETIYKIIREDKQAGGKLYKHTRHQLKHRKRPLGEKIPIKNRVSIDKRPEIVNLKQRFGDREFDTIMGENNQGAVLTMLERTTAFMMMKKLEHGKNAKEVTKVAVRLLTAYINSVHSITADKSTNFRKKSNHLVNQNIYFNFALSYLNSYKTL